MKIDCKQYRPDTPTRKYDNITTAQFTLHEDHIEYMEVSKGRLLTINEGQTLEEAHNLDQWGEVENWVGWHLAHKSDVSLQLYRYPKEGMYQVNVVIPDIELSFYADTLEGIKPLFKQLKEWMLSETRTQGILSNLLKYFAK